MSPAKTDVPSLPTAFPVPRRQLWWILLFRAQWLVLSALSGGEWPHPLPLGPTLPPGRQGNQEAWPGCPSPRTHPTTEQGRHVSQKQRQGAVLLPNWLRQAGTQTGERTRWLRVCNPNSHRGPNALLPKLFHPPSVLLPRTPSGAVLRQRGPAGHVLPESSWGFCNLQGHDLLLTSGF